MDDVSAYNRSRWDALVRARALFTRPWLNLDPETALQRVDPHGRLGDLRGKDVLCLAAGGGQQSAAFSLAGARVTVFDLSAGQLERDREAAVLYGYTVETVQGDMRDLSALAPHSFDIVYQPYSINFVPDCRPVFAEVARVIRPGGVYMLYAANPFAVGMGSRSWNGHAYELRGFYQQGAAVESSDEDWVLPSAPNQPSIPQPREYRHLLGTLLNGPLDLGFSLIGVHETIEPASDDLEPGTWSHFTATTPPWMCFWFRLTPQP